MEVFRLKKFKIDLISTYHTHTDTHSSRDMYIHTLMHIHAPNLLSPTRILSAVWGEGKRQVYMLLNVNLSLI